MLKRSKNILFVALLLIFCNKLLTQEQRIDHYPNAADSLLYILKDSKEDSSKVKILLAIACNNYISESSGSNNLENAISYANQSLALAEKINFRQGIGKANSILGMCSNRKFDFVESRKYHYAALKIALENGNKIQTLTEYYRIGIAYNMTGNYNESLQNHLAALKIIEEINEISWYPYSYAGIGNVYLNMKNYSEADKYFANAYAAAEKNLVKSLMGEILVYFGNSLFAQTKYDDALTRYISASKLLEDQQDKDHLAACFFGIANTYYKKASNEKDSLKRLQYFLEAIPYFHKTLVLDKETNRKNGGVRNYSGLIEAYMGIRNFKNALTYYELYSATLDSFYNKSTYIKISELKIKYEKEKAVADLKAQQEKEKIKEEMVRVTMLADQKLAQQKQMAETNAVYEKSIAEEKMKQEKIRAEKRQTNNMLLMGLIIVVLTSTFLLLYLRQRSQKKRALEKAEAIHKMAELELQSLRSQLNPHFMFNSLNSIQTLIMKEQTDKSQSYLSRFARLLRMLLENADKQFVPLDKEIELLQLYLGLENLRIPDLQYSISTDPVLNTEQILIPNMILQPYVENAIWHGLSHKETNRQLQIRIFSEPESVHYEIEDNGVGRKKAEELKSLFRKQHQSKGMELLSKRITLLNKEYASSIRTEISDVMNNNEITGTLVSIKVPVMPHESLQN